MADGEVGFAWAKWPAGFPNVNYFNNPDEATDETLIRSIWSPYATVLPNHYASSSAIRFITFGLIAWDTSDPSFFDQVIYGAGSGPDPYYAADDWILRKVYVFCPPGDASVTTMVGFPATDIDSSSKAMRKLPPSTGVLLAVSVHEPQGGSATWCSFGVDTRIAVKRAR